MRYFFTVIIAVFIFFPSHTFAETKEIISEGTYNMGDGETPSVAESRALLQAKRIALEQAGTYVESWTKVENLQLTKDEIQVLASGIMEVEILDKKRTVVGDGFHFWVQIKARVNPDKIEEMAKRVKEKSVVEDYKKIQEAYDKSQREIEELKKQLAGAKGEKEKKQVEAKITDEERLFEASQWFEKGLKHDLNKEYDDAIEAFTSAIAIWPDYADYGYYARGTAYYKKGEYYRAIENFNKAIALTPNVATTYAFRGNAYVYKGQYDRAIEDYNKAIAIDPNVAQAYSNRGLVYANKEQYDRAIEDYSKAIALNPNLAFAYVQRGHMYGSKEQYNRAIEDYSKAIALDPNLAQAYTSRGFVYDISDNMGRAISDFQKACDMGDENGCKGLQMVLEKR